MESTSATVRKVRFNGVKSHGKRQMS